MDRKQANVYLATILTTIGDIPHGTPSGHLYAALMGQLNLDNYTMLIGVCKDSGMVKESAHVLTLTTKGQEMVKKIKELVPGA